MNTKKIIIFSVFFVIAGFFLTGYIFADEEAIKAESGEISKIREEQKILIEKVSELEAALKVKEEVKDKDKDKEIVPPIVTPDVHKEQVAYVKDELNFVNARAEIGTNNPIVGKVLPKSPMVILETKDDWYRVKLENGDIAWVASWVVRVQEE